MNAAMKRFAADHGMTEHDVDRLVRMADRAARCNAKACNGDPHPRAKNSRDKNECAELWDADVSTEAVKIADAARPYGLGTVTFTGLRPCLRDAAGRYVEIPHRGE